jgi:hypothetical protein
MLDNILIQSRNHHPTITKGAINIGLISQLIFTVAACSNLSFIQNYKSKTEVGQRYTTIKTGKKLECGIIDQSQNK